MGRRLYGKDNIFVGRELAQPYMRKRSAGAIDAFIEKKLAGKTVNQKELKKVSDALARRGFSWSDISNALGRYGARMEEDV